MAAASIFRSYTLPNGKEIRTMREDVRNAALQAVRDKAGSPPPSGGKAPATSSEPRLGDARPGSK